MQFNFNAQQHEPQYGSGGGSLPAGKYTVIISKAEAKATKDGTGGMLVLEYKVTSGPHTGSVMTDRLNIWNANAIAAEIGQKQMSAICYVIGQFTIQDTQQLCNIPMQIEVGPQKDRPEYTEVKAVFDANGNPPNKAGQGQPVQQPAAQQAQAPAPAPAAPAANAGWGAPPAAAEQPPQQAATAVQQQPAQGGAWGAPQSAGAGVAPQAPAPASGGWAPPAGATTGGWQQPT
jgi:hypothetical protein